MFLYFLDVFNNFFVLSNFYYKNILMFRYMKRKIFIHCVFVEI